MSTGLKSALWLVWLAIAVAFTAGIVRWHVEYFRSPGLEFYRAASIGLPLLAGGALLWIRLRTGFLWRYELAAIVAIPVVATLWREPRAGLVVAALFACCYCLGRDLCERCRCITDAPAADLLFSTAAGFALLNTVLFVTGLARIWYPWLFALLLFAPLIGFHRHLRRYIHTLLAVFRRWGQLQGIRGSLAGLLIPFTAILVACTTALMLAPTVSWDAMKMHLPLSQYYLQVHGLEPKPGLDYSFFPQATESMLTLVWALGGQSAAQLAAPLFFALTVLAAWVLAREMGADAEEALIGIVLAVSLPIVHWAESMPKTDSELTFFLLASLVAALRWRAAHEFKWAALGALFLASAFATKDIALLGAIPLSVIFVPAAWRQPRRIRSFAALTIIFIGVALVWNIRRFILTGNPIAPLVLGRSMVPGWPPDPTFGGTMVRMLELPWDLYAHGHDFSESVLISPLGIAFALLLPVWFLTPRPRRAELVCLWFAIAVFLAWGWLSPLVRYAAAGLIVFALLTAVRLARFWRASPVLIRASLAAAVLWAMIPAICACMIVEINGPQLLFLGRAIGREEYLNRALNTHASLAWLRYHTTEDDRILALENCSDVYAPPFPRYRSICAFRPWNEIEVEGQLRGAPFSYLLAPPGDQEAVRSAARLSGATAVEAYRDADFVIYRLEPAK